MTLQVRWLGRVPYREALAVQEAMFTHGVEDHLLLLEHPHVFTHGPRADLAVNVLVDPAVGRCRTGVGEARRRCDVSRARSTRRLSDRQRVQHGRRGRSCLRDPTGDRRQPRRARRRRCRLPRPSTPACGSVSAVPNPRKICAIGVRLAHGRTMHGFALNVAPDMRYMRDYIVPCGIADKPVTSLAEEGVDASLEDVAERRRPSRRGECGATARWSVRTSRGSIDPTICRPSHAAKGPARSCVAWHRSASPTVWRSRTRKPDWLRPKVVHGPEVIALKKTVRDHGLVTVCEEAGCPNLSDCWADGTATFMVLGERCTRACGFCLVDTQQAAGPGGRRARSCGRGRCQHGTGSRRADDGGARRPGRRRHGARRPVRRGDPTNGVPERASRH